MSPPLPFLSPFGREACSSAKCCRCRSRGCYYWMVAIYFWRHLQFREVLLSWFSRYPYWPLSFKCISLAAGARYKCHKSLLGVGMSAGLSQHYSSLFIFVTVYSAENIIRDFGCANVTGPRGYWIITVLALTSFEYYDSDFLHFGLIELFLDVILHYSCVFA